MLSKNFLTVSDVAEYMGVSNSKAYKIVQGLNNELKSQGYITVAGKVSRLYFQKKVFGIVEE